MTIELPSRDRCMLVMRDVLMAQPGQQMRSVDLRDMLALNGFGKETIRTAEKAAEAEGHIERTGKSGKTRFRWSDEPIEIDRDPRKVIRAPATAKDFVGERYASAMEWTAAQLMKASTTKQAATGRRHMQCDQRAKAKTAMLECVAKIGRSGAKEIAENMGVSTTIVYDYAKDLISDRALKRIKVKNNLYFELPA